jgi:hypothetical protein
MKVKRIVLDDEVQLRELRKLDCLPVIILRRHDLAVFLVEVFSYAREEVFGAT